LKVADGTCVHLKANQCFETDAAVDTSDTKGRKLADGACVTLTDAQCVNTAASDAPKAFSAADATGTPLTIRAATTKQCVDVANTDPATECYDATREAKGDVIADVQTRKADGNCKLATVAAGKCFNVTASPQALADVTTTLRRNKSSHCFTLKATECFEDSAASTVSAMKLKHSTSNDCVNRTADKCFESDKAVKTSSTKALNVATGACVVLKATECNKNGAVQTENAT
jgi:hypothetical protein